MSLRRNEWLEMWGSIKVIEFNSREIKSITNGTGPSVRNQVRGLTLGIQVELNKMKAQIESVIGQMERG